MLQGLDIQSRVIKKIGRVPVRHGWDTVCCQDQSGLIYPMISSIKAGPVNFHDSFEGAAGRRLNSHNEDAVYGYFSQVILSVIVLSMYEFTFNL